MTTRSESLFTREIVTSAIRDSFLKLDPRTLVRNPVIFIVELGSVVVSAIFVIDAVRGDAGQEPLWFTGAIAIWLWLTVLLRQLRRGHGGGPRQGAGEGAARHAHDDRRSPAAAGRRVSKRCRRRSSGAVTSSSSTAGELIPADGEIIEGVGSVDESAITGESAPVIREAGGDRSGVTGGTRLLSDSS